jgi:hypothetical protein
VVTSANLDISELELHWPLLVIPLVTTGAEVAGPSGSQWSSKVSQWTQWVIPTLVLANRPRSCNKALSLTWVLIDILLKSFVLTARTHNIHNFKFGSQLKEILD